MKFIKVLIFLLISANSYAQYYSPVKTPIQWTQGGFDSLFIPARDTITPGDKTKPWITYRAPTLYVWTTNKWTAISGGGGGGGGTDYTLPQADSNTLGGIRYNTDFALDLNNRLGIAPGKKALWNTIANLPLFYATGDSTRGMIRDSIAKHKLKFNPNNFNIFPDSVDIINKPFTETDSIYKHDPAHFLTSDDITNIQNIDDTSIHPRTSDVHTWINGIKQDTVKFNSAQFYKTPDDIVNIYGGDVVGGSSNAVVTTTDSLRTLSSIDPGTVYETTDKGGGFWRYDPFDITTPDNVGTVIINGTKRLKRIYSGAVDVRWFGAKGDGITDDRAAIKAAISVPDATLIDFPVGAYFISDSISIKRTLHLKGHGTWFGYQSIIYVASGKYGFVVEAYNTPTTEPSRSIALGTGQGSEIDHLRFVQQAPIVKGHAIWAHARVYVHDCFIEGFGGDGIHIEATGNSSSTWATVQRVDMNMRAANATTFYTSAPTVTITGDGSGATAHAVLGGGISSVLVSNGGRYSSQPAVLPRTNTGDVETEGMSRAFATMGVSEPFVITGGSGYTSATLSISGDGTGATGTVTLSGGVVTGITITDPGTGYTTTPTLTITGNGVGATASCYLKVLSVTPNWIGSDWETPPAIYFQGGTSQFATGGAVAAATLGYFLVKKIVVDNVGSGYTFANVAISGGGGSGALATAWLGKDIQGNANNWKIENCRIIRCFNGVYIRGGDANAGYAIGVDASSNRANGMFDFSFLGNKYIACHTSANILRAYVSVQSTAFNDFDNCYSEGDQYPSWGMSSTSFTGGDHGAGVEKRNNVIISGKFPNKLETTNAGVINKMDVSLNINPDNGDIFTIWNSSLPVGSPVRWKMQNVTGDLSLDASNTSSFKWYTQTGRNTTNLFGRTTPQPYSTYIDRLFLGSSNDIATARALTSSAVFPPSLRTTQTEWAKGDFVLNAAPTAASGVMGWSRLTTGAGDSLGVDWLPIKTAAAGGAVSSVGLTMPGVLFNSVVSGSPITSSGTFLPTLANQTAYTVLGNHTAGTTTPTFGKIPVQSINATGSTYNGTKVLFDNGTWAVPSSSGGISPNYVDSPEHLFTGTTTWTGTAPTGGASYYRWTQIGKQVTVYINFRATGAGASNSSVLFSWPSDLPIPTTPNGVTTGQSMYPGSGWLSASLVGGGTSARNNVTIYKETDGTPKLYIATFTALAAFQAYATITYWTNDIPSGVSQ